MLNAHELEFTKDGEVFDLAQLEALQAACGGLTDLVAVSHGWNNDKAQARSLYWNLKQSIEDVLAANSFPRLASRRLGFLEVLWPSKKFADEDLIPGGGAASATQANDAALRRILDELARDPSSLGDTHENAEWKIVTSRAKELIPELHSATHRAEFVQCLRTILNPDERHVDDASQEFFTDSPEELFDKLAQRVPLDVIGGAGGATSLADGGAAGLLGDMLEGPIAAARRLANFATYYQMKTRAGSVGRKGLGPVLSTLRSRSPNLGLHLVGHSFGGRLVTAAASTLAPDSQRVTLTLLQAAFSHHGLAKQFDGKNDGAFRTVLGDHRVSGPVLITHTKNDRAVGIAYPLASRIAHDVAATLGDANDPYGGMGRNGAQHTPETAGLAGVLAEIGTEYPFEPGGVFNLLADGFIKDHGDVTGHQVAYALICAIAAS